MNGSFGVSSRSLLQLVPVLMKTYYTPTCRLVPLGVWKMTRGGLPCLLGTANLVSTLLPALLSACYALSSLQF